MNNAYNYYLGEAHKIIEPNKNEPVTVSEFSLRVGNRLYRLDDISKYRIVTRMASRVPGILVIVLGIVFIALGIFNGYYPYTYLPAIILLYDYIPAVTIYNITFSKFRLLEGIGIALCLWGLLRLILIRKTYFLQIVLQTEEMDVFASRKQDQLIKIVDALRKKIDKRQPGSRKKARTYAPAI